MTAFVAINIKLSILSNVHSLTLDQKELKVSELGCCLVRTVRIEKQQQSCYIKKINDRMLRKSREVINTLMWNCELGVAFHARYLRGVLSSCVKWVSVYADTSNHLEKQRYSVGAMRPPASTVGTMMQYPSKRFGIITSTAAGWGWCHCSFPSKCFSQLTSFLGIVVTRHL